MAVQKTLTQARERLKLGHWQEALALLEQASIAPAAGGKKNKLDLELGKLYLALRQPDRAIPPLSRLVQTAPDHAQAHYALGLAYRAQEQWDKASAALEQADRLAPNDAAILSVWGWVMFQQGQKPEGKQMVERALRLDLGRVGTLLDLTMIYVAETNLPAAIACAQRAYQFGMGGVETREMLDMLYTFKHHLEEQRIATSDDRPPRSEREWHERISVAGHPVDIINQMAGQAHPQAEKELQALADQVNRWWNTTPRPELGGIAPDQAAQLQRRASRVELPPAPPWLGLNPAAAEANPLRRDMVAFLTHLRDVKYTATTSQGNLPLKAVRSINALLTNPVRLEEEIGDHTYRVRSIREVRSLDFLQTLAITGKLADFAPGRRITLTDGGIAFLASAPIRQLTLLLDAWWWHTNWLYIHYWEVFEDFEETALPYLTRTLLGKVAPDVWVPLKEFYEALIEMGRLDELMTTVHKDALKHGLEVMIVQALASFGMLEIKKKPKQIGTMIFDEPVAFRITSLGHQLLRTI